jgi:hypothetical protein
MTSFVYWPYDEVSLEANIPGELTVRTPWMEATTSATPFNPAQVLRLKTKLNDKSLSADDIVLVNDFFKHFHHYPLAYILPSLKDEDGLDTHSLEDNANLDGNFDDIVTRILVLHADFDHAEAEKLLMTLSRQWFEWDHDAALHFANLETSIHPESVFSIARRYHLLELLANDRGRKIFSSIRKQGAQELRHAVARLVRQNHYVTEQCNHSLRPAIFIAQQAAPLVEEFMAAERGHDKILKKALLHLSVKAEDIAVSVQTKALMALLRYMAERNFLAFAMAVDAFERNNYEDIDPIAKLLIDGGFEKAAEFVNLHMKINDEGEHENIAQQFLRYMAPCDTDYVLEALRLMEILSVVMCSVSQSAEG